MDNDGPSETLLSNGIQWVFKKVFIYNNAHKFLLNYIIYIFLFIGRKINC